MRIKLRPFKYRISLSIRKEARNDLDNKHKVSLEYLTSIYDANP